MPADFTKCVDDGGKVVTKNLKGHKYIHICYDKKGNSYEGEVKTKKKAKARKKKKANQIEKSRALVSDLRRLKDHFDSLRNN